MTDFRTPASPPHRNAAQDRLDALVALYSQGRIEDALALAGELIGLHPSCEITHNIAGALTVAAGRPDDALALYDRAIAIAPDYVEAWNNHGNALKALDRLDEALASYDAAIDLLPDYAEAHLNRAIVLRMTKRLAEALAANGEAIRCNPQLAQAYGNRGNVLQDLNHFAEALADQDRAIALAPSFALAHVNRGNALQALQRLPEAIAAYDHAIELAPAQALAHRNRGATLKGLKRLDEALASFEAAWTLDPADTTALSEALFLNAQMGRWTDHDRRAELARRVLGGEAIPPFHVFALADDPQLQLANARGWAHRHFPPQPVPDFPTPPARDGRIRVGYFSADFYNHATMALMARMFERHDRTRFEVHAFSYGPQIHDAVRARVIEAVEHFHDISRLDDAAVAQLSRDLGIDVAVDLKGYTDNGRPGIFAWRAARHQVGYLGYPGTMGADYIDHMIADRVTVPETARDGYSEAIAHLSGCYQVNDSARAIAAAPPSRAGLGLPEQGFVFCCFNGAYKITPAAFDIWMRLLARVEGSVLWLLDDNPWASASLRREAAIRGVDPFRLVFAPRVGMAEHLARQTHADLFLDTFAVNAHTTASEALWAGLPLVTKPGRSFVARVAASLLQAIDLPELIAASAEDYEALALALATDPARLAAIRARLAANRATAPLFDTERFTREIEDLFAAIVARR